MYCILYIDIDSFHVSVQCISRVRYMHTYTCTYAHTYYVRTLDIMHIQGAVSQVHQFKSFCPFFSLSCTNTVCITHVKVCMDMFVYSMWNV